MYKTTQSKVCCQKILSTNWMYLLALSINILVTFDLNILPERTYTFKDAEKWTFKNLIFVKFDEASKLGKVFENFYNYGRWLILKDILD